MTLDQEVKTMTYVSVPTPATAAPTNNNANQGARSKSKTYHRQKGKGAKNNPFCTICNTEGHFYEEFPTYPSVTERKSALKARGRCEDCGALKRPNHYCPLTTLCKICNGSHRENLCEIKGKNQQNPER